MSVDPSSRVTAIEGDLSPLNQFLLTIVYPAASENLMTLPTFKRDLKRYVPKMSPARQERPAIV
jgi:hypothetical protein